MIVYMMVIVDSSYMVMMVVFLYSHITWQYPIDLEVSLRVCKAISEE